MSWNSSVIKVIGWTVPF